MKENKNKQFLAILVSVVVIIICTILFFSKAIKKVETTVAKPECIKSGCSGQLCVEKGSESGITTCEWTKRYACYKLANCERQTSGKCGFTANSEFEKCLMESR